MTAPPMAWYGASWTYYEPGPDELNARAERERAARLEGFSPDRFTPRPGPGGGTDGIVPGRFLPVHEGHRFLIEVARAFVDRVWVFVRVTPSDPVPWEVRRDWLTGLFPDVEVVAVDDPPWVRREFERLWDERIRAHVDPDYVILGGDYGSYHGIDRAAEISRRLRIPAIVIPRRGLPVSGSRIRQDPAAHARHLPPPVRAWYSIPDPGQEAGPVKRVCLIGPESTGKSTLAERLAGHYGTVWAPEVARERPGGWTPESVSQTAHAQRASQDALARRANRVLICDTDLLTVRLWSERLYDAVPDWLTAAAETDTGIDLYLLTAADVPYTGTEFFDRPAERAAFHDRCRAELTRLGHRFVVLDGDLPGRFDTAVAAIDDLLAG